MNSLLDFVIVEILVLGIIIFGLRRWLGNWYDFCDKHKALEWVIIAVPIACCILVAVSSAAMLYILADWHSSGCLCFRCTMIRRGFID